MNAGMGVNLLLALGFLVLVIASLMARRVPLIRVLVQLLCWAAIFAALYLVIVQRSRIDPYLGRATRWLNLDSQTVVGREVRIAMAPDGHFWARVKIDGIARRMLIDSGATVTAVSTQTAAAANLTPSTGLLPVIVQTANGTVSAKTARIGELTMGDIVARDLSVVVSPAFGTTDVLGMNFLSRLKSWRVEGSTLYLEPHHPQDLT